jgi:hypothetical protein
MLGAIQIVGLIVGIYVLFRCWELAFQAIGRKDLGGISAGLIITASGEIVFAAGSSSDRVTGFSGRPQIGF